MLFPAIVAGLVLAFAAAPTSAQAAAERVVSLNLCADQILLSLVPPERIVGLSPNARDPDLSHFAERAAGLPVLSGSAEEVLALQPDLVLAGPFAGADAKAFLRRAGIRVVEVPVPETLAGVADQLRQMGDLLMVPEEAAALARELDRAIAALRSDSSAPRPRALYLQRRGIVTGRGTLMNDLFEAAGVENAAAVAGYARYDLERLVALDLDLIVLDTPARPSDQGAAMLVHPALDKRFSGVPRVILPLPMLVCPGPWTAGAVMLLATAASAVEGQ